MTFIQRVKDLGLPLDQFVVIGSGLLDVYGLRSADDIDLVVSEPLYSSLKSRADYQEATKHGELYLTSDNVEVWQTWGSGHEFEVLLANAVVIDGIKFINPEQLIVKKIELGRDKDLRDIILLEQYLHEH